MKRFVWCSIILAVGPIVFLNSFGREAFLGYYLGIVAMWLVAVSAAHHAQVARIK